MKHQLLSCLILTMLLGVTSFVVRSIDYSKHPIIAVGLPKSGTTSLAVFLNQSHPDIHMDHQVIHCPEPNFIFPLPAVTVENGVVWPANDGTRVRTCDNAVFIHRAIADGKQPLHYLLHNTTKNAFTQLDHEGSGGNLVLPQLDALNMILDAYPNALFIHHVRNASAHASSIMRWSSLGQRMHGLIARYPQINTNATLENQFEQWVLLVKEETRLKFLLRPLVRYLEVDVEGDPDAAAKISIFVGATRFHPMPHANTNNMNPAHHDVGRELWSKSVMTNKLRRK